MLQFAPFKTLDTGAAVFNCRAQSRSRTRCEEQISSKINRNGKKFYKNSPQSLAVFRCFLIELKSFMLTISSSIFLFFLFFAYLLLASFLYFWKILLNFFAHGHYVLKVLLVFDENRKIASSYKLTVTHTNIYTSGLFCIILYIYTYIYTGRGICIYRRKIGGNLKEN